MQSLLIWPHPSSLSLFTHRATCSAFACAVPPTWSTSQVLLSRIWGQRCLLFSLKVKLGRRNGTKGSKALHHPPSLFLQVPLVPVNTDWERILAWEQGQRTQQNQSCLCSAEEQHGMQPVSHNIRPFGLASTTFSNWQYNLNDFPRPPNPRVILLLRII